MKTISPLTLKIDENTWHKFKEKVPHTRTLNGTVIELIEAFITK